MMSPPINNQRMGGRSLAGRELCSRKSPLSLIGWLLVE
jgi:hypothetical protein